MLHAGVAAAVKSASRTARHFADATRDAKNVVTVALAASTAQRDWSRTWGTRPATGESDSSSSSSLKATVLRFAAWAVDARRPELITRALDDRGSLRPVAHLSLGPAYGDGVSRRAAPACHAVDGTAYAAVAGGAPGDVRRWAEAWRVAGASDGACRVVATASRVDQKRARQLVAAARSDADASPSLSLIHI